MTVLASHIFTPNLFAEKSIIVTGAAGEIGKVISKTFAALGGHVLLIGRKETKLTELRDEISASGGSACAFAGDIRDEVWINATLPGLSPSRIVSLVNCAGGQYVQAAHEITPKGWRAVIETNLTGTWLMTQAMARLWQNAGIGGAITQITLQHSRGLPGMAHSCAARGGIEAFSRTAAIEWGRAGIRVNCIAPGLIDTPTLRNYGTDLIARLERQGNPTGRLGSPADIAAGCAFLASPMASFLTGVTLPIDGGQALWGDNWTIEKPASFCDANIIESKGNSND